MAQSDRLLEWLLARSTGGVALAFSGGVEHHIHVVGGKAWAGFFAVRVVFPGEHFEEVHPAVNRGHI